MSSGRAPRDDTADSPTKVLEAKLFLGLVAVVLLVEALFVVRYERREIVWAYPAHHDQATYLSAAYENYETIRRIGLFEGLSAALRRPSPTGLLLPLEASVLFLLVGPSRLAALSLVFLHFALLQLSVAWTAARLAGRGRAALLGVGLLLMSRTPWYWVGGVADFRLDLAAASLYGVFLCVVVRSDVFVRAGWSAIAGVAAGLCLLTRFLTAAYIGPLLVAALLISFFQRKAGEPLAPRRLLGISLAFGTAIALSAPILLRSGPEIYRYYIVGHLLAADGQIRATLAGFSDPLSALAYYPLSILEVHPGPATLAFAALLLGAAHRRRRAKVVSTGPNFLLLLSAVVVPLALLTFDADRSPVVASIVVAPFLLLLLEQALPRIDLKWLTVSSAGALAVGLAVAAFFLFRAGPGSRQRAELEELNRLYDKAYAAVVETGRPEVQLAVDRMADTFDAPVFRAMTYERHRLLPLLKQELWTSLHPVSEEDAVTAIGRSDLVLLTVREEPGRAAFPFDRSMQRLGPRLFEICRKRFVSLGRFRIPGREVELFARGPGPAPA